MQNFLILKRLQVLSKFSVISLQISAKYGVMRLTHNVLPKLDSLVHRLNVSKGEQAQINAHGHDIAAIRFCEVNLRKYLKQNSEESGIVQPLMQLRESQQMWSEILKHIS